MTARAPGGSSRGAGAPTTTRTRDGVGAILIVLALGLALRLIIAYQYPGTGFAVDLASFRGWAANLADAGLHGFYERPFFHDYTPGYLYVLALVGEAAQALHVRIDDLLKIPPILADVALGWLVWSMARDLGAGSRAALVGAALVVANPVTWFDSVTWGQVDSFGVVFLLLAVRELWRDRPERAAILTVVAALIKPQLGILIPVVAAVTIRRALWPAGDRVAGPDELPRGDGAGTAGRGLLDRLRAAERATDRPIRILTTGLAGFLTAVVLCAPFGLSVLELGADGAIRSGLVEQIFKTAGGYPYITVNAYNPWALVQLGESGLAANGLWVCDTLLTTAVPGGPSCPTALHVGPLPAVVVGTGLLLVAFAAVCLAIARRPDRLTILLGVALLAIAFFILPTRVHERYMFPFFAVGAILAAVSWRWLVAYVVLSAAAFANMYVVLTTLYPGNPGIVDWLGIGSAIRAPAGVTTIALANLAAAAWAFAQLRAAGVRRLAREVAASGDGGRRGPSSLAAGPASPSLRAAQAPTGTPSVMPPGPAGPVMPAGRPTPPTMPTWSERPSFAEAGAWGWFRARLTDRPLRPDRSRALHDEPGGRVDRLDLWLVVVLIAAVLGLRMFRLAEPYQMHFDEVYHARTATEFLQQWRYGISHDIYEWTHPHLAKYAMAGGLVAWGDDRVSATSELEVPVRDALVEPRRDGPGLPGGRAGDRLHVATGEELRSYDLVDRGLEHAVPIPGAAALAVDPSVERLYVGTDDGRIVTVDLAVLDAARGTARTAAAGEPEGLATVDGAIVRLFAVDDGQTLLAATDDDRLITVDAVSGEALATVSLPGIAGIAAADKGPVVTAFPGSVADPAAAAATLAELLGGDAAAYDERLRSDAETIVVAGIAGATQRTAVEAAIEDGRLAGLAIDDLPRVAVAAATGLTFLAPATGQVVATIPLDGGAFGLARVAVDDAKLYVTTGGSTDGAPGEVAVIAVAGDAAKDGPVVQRKLPLPGPGTWVGWDEATQMIHVLGAAPDGQGSTVYVIEPHANAVFADARLPFEPVAQAMDVAKPYPSADRQQILVFGRDGSAASVEIGKHAFAWRLPGVLAGAAMAGLLYLLTRLLFRRRAIAVLVGVLVLAEGMLFVQSRIGMNDAYVGLGIVAAYALFAAIWTGRWRWRGAFWLAMPLIGLCLGLALASKWVALYALGALGILILARSALGRIVLVAGLVGLTAVLGYIALAVPEGSGIGNLAFVAIMVALTVVAVAVTVLHPIAWSDDELRFAVGAPAALGGIVALGAIAVGAAATEIVVGPVAVTPLHLAAALVASSLVVAGIVTVAGRHGFGPLARPLDPRDSAALLPPPAPPPDQAWLRPGALAGLPIAWMVVCLVAIPLAVYVASYVPWALVEGHRITDSWPPGHEGQTLVGLTGEMYRYHNNLTAGHAASSPWWAWPFDLKPVWFYQEGLAGSTIAAVYDAGNLVIWWLGVPALAFVAWQAYARRSLALALVAIGFACQWIPWARIDRAAFQYHYYTSLPFLVLALAYFVAEIWHGPSRRTWLLARLAAGLAIVGPALLWLFARPLCAVVGVERANPGSQACPPLIPQFVLTGQTLALALVVGVSVLVVLRQLGSLDGRHGRGAVRQLVPLAATTLVALVALFAVRQIPDAPVLSLAGVPVEPIVLLVGLPLALLAALVATARDARRFAAGIVTAAVAWFVVLYPNIAALPLPSTIANAYQGILPTYLYAFWFPVNTVDRSQPLRLLEPGPILLAAALALLCLVTAYTAWVWRLALAERQADELDRAGAAADA